MNNVTNEMINILGKYNFWNQESIETGYYRKMYVEKFSAYLDNRLVKVILGQRRVGKSYLLRMLIHYLMEEKAIPPRNIIYINKDIAALEFIKDSETLLQVIEQKDVPHVERDSAIG